ncbi:MAG: ADP-ribosylglycohydrolase family protein [Clostridia bacterium]|nr:ADP-ribosylglycohydrolase family protein [Clostridia bacterium]
MFAKPYDTKITIDYNNADGLNNYHNELMKEYVQSIEEGLDIEKYKNLFESVSALESNEYKARMSDIIYEMVINADTRPDYKYNEPSELKEIKKLRKAHSFAVEMPDDETLRKKLSGAWTGRACGCLLGKPIECIRSNELIPLLKETDNYPMHRYILSTDITDEVCSHYKFGLKNKPYADTVDGMPVDDDTNYVVLAQKIVEDFGRNFGSEDVATAWMKYQSIHSYFTAERTAFANFTKCIMPPASAMYKNVAREWIGAQIRGDYFGYINPGNPEKAAEMAFNDARISHVKNGVYGEMFAAAMIACAAVTSRIDDIILGGLAQIPSTSRLYESVMRIFDCYKNGVTVDECFNIIHSDYDEHTDHGWCHVISNAMIVTAALLYGEGNFGRSICCAVGMAFDTDCNGATVGSILGMRNTIDGIDEYWKKPVNGKIHTSIFGVGTVDIEKAVEKTIEHINHK